jgi:hypothetical protein
MEVNIEELVSNIRIVDGDSVLSPKTMERIVGTVLEAVNMKEQHRMRVQAERKVTGGVQEEQEQGD